jgi:phage terminase large subunit
LTGHLKDDQIERVSPTKPITGVVIFKYGHAARFDTNDPDQGKWVKVSASLINIKQAFSAIGIDAVVVADEHMQQNIIGVYFGIESQNK